MPGQAQKEAQVAAAAGKGDAHETKKENNGATMESVQEQPTEEEDLEMEWSKVEFWCSHVFHYSDCTVITLLQNKQHNGVTVQKQSLHHV